MTKACHIAAEQLSVWFADNRIALHDISVAIPGGQFTALIGPSGCGKSTFLRCVAGLQPASKGRVVIDKANGRSANLAYVFQDSTLLPWRSVLKNIGLPLELRGHSRAARMAAAIEAMHRCGLAGADASKRPHMLSGGMRMRVSLARALVTQPDILLLDEPFAAIDDISRQQLNEELMQLWMSQQWTALFVTHNVSEAVFLSQRVLVISRKPGQILADVPIPFEYPRPVSLRTSTEFASLASQLAEQLRRAAA